MIVPIKKARLAVLNEELEKTLKIIQKKSLLMFISEKNSIIEDTNNGSRLTKDGLDIVKTITLWI